MSAHFAIRHRVTDAVLFEGQFDTMRLCVEAAVRRGTRLDGAGLVGANLAGANLDGADLAGASLDSASLVGASLVGTRLVGASLDGASLVGTRFDGAILRNDDIATGAPLRRAMRADGYEFFLWPTRAGWRVGAGCRWFTFKQAWAHWSEPRPGGDPHGLNAESIDILTMFSLAMDRVEDAS